MRNLEQLLYEDVSPKLSPVFFTFQVYSWVCRNRCRNICHELLSSLVSKSNFVRCSLFSLAKSYTFNIYRNFQTQKSTRNLRSGIQLEFIQTKKKSKIKRNSHFWSNWQFVSSLTWIGVWTLRSRRTWYIAVLGKSKQTAQHRIPPNRDSNFSLVCDVLAIADVSVFLLLISGSLFPDVFESVLRLALLLLLLADWLIGGGLGLDCELSTWISADIMGIMFELSTFRLTACCWFCIKDDIDDTDAELVGSAMSAILPKW